MKPIDCQPDDRRRYFNDGFMLYNGEPVKVRFSERGSSVTGRSASSDPLKPLKMNLLEPYYPEGRALNVYDCGIYVGRRARQTARRTASSHHYEIHWCHSARPISLDSKILWALVRDFSYYTYDEAMRALKDKAMISVAISEDMILSRSTVESRVEVVWHSDVTGYIENGVYIPTYEGSNFTKLARQGLLELEAPCV